MIVVGARQILSIIRPTFGGDHDFARRQFGALREIICVGPEFFDSLPDQGLGTRLNP